MALPRSERTPGTPESRGPSSDRVQAESQRRTWWTLEGIKANVRSMFGGRPTETVAPTDAPQPPEEKIDPNGPISGKEILAWAKAKGFGEEMDFETAGVLIEQGSSTDYVFIIYEAEAAEVEYCVDGECHPISTLDANSPVGEVSTLSDSQTTAQVRLRKPTKVSAIRKEDFKKILEDPILGERAMTLVRQRLLHTANVHQQIEEYKAEKALELAGDKGNVEAAHALDVADVDADMPQGGGTDTREFHLTGIHRDTKEVRRQRFKAYYERKGRSDITLTITTKDGGVSMPVKILDGGRKLETGHVKFKEDAGFGFYSRIMQYLLRNVQHISATIIEDNTLDFVNTRKDGKLIPHSELAAHSPVVAARKGFISVTPKSTDQRSESFGRRGQLRSDDDSIPLDSYRVSREMEMILAVATDIERSILTDDETVLKKRYDMGRAEILSNLVALINDYLTTPEYKQTPTHIRDLMDCQFLRIDELAGKYPQTA